MKEIVNDGFAKVVKPYIDAQDKKSREVIAPVEVSPAEAAHSVGDQIIYNGLLYDVTAPIAVGDSLATSGAGENISAADNIEAQIKATKSQIQAAAAQAAAQNKNTQEMLAPVEEDETDASRAYAIGEQLILDGILYNVIDAIAQHGIITAEGAGANIEEADDVTTQLSSINQTLTDDVAALSTEIAKRTVESITFFGAVVTADGVKDWKTLVAELATAVIAKAASNNVDKYQFTDLWLETVGTFYLCDSRFYTPPSNVDMSFYAFSPISGTTTSTKVSFRNNANTVYITKWDGTSFNDIRDNVPDSGTHLTVNAIGYKFIT